MPRSLPVRVLHRFVRRFLSLPEPALRRIAGPSPRNDHGHALDLATQVLLKLTKARGDGGLGAGTVRGERKRFDASAPIPDFRPVPLHRVEDRDIPSHASTQSVRVYEPTSRTGGNRPACVYFHGGGFVLGDLESHDGVCRYLAAQTGAVVIAVEYGLAPENKFPGPARDAIVAFRWVVAHAAELGLDPARIAVAGDSAGGNLAAVVAVHEREQALKPCFQLLIYPVTDFTHTTESYRLFREGYLLEAKTMAWFRVHHLTDPERELRDPMGSVLFAPDVRGAPPAFILTAGFDPLRDEGDAYAKKLEAAGVPVQYLCAEGLVHGFFSMGGVLPEARRHIDLACEALERGLRRPIAPA